MDMDSVQGDRMSRLASIVAGASLVLCFGAPIVAGRGGASQARPTGGEETKTLAAGWAALSAGDAEKAAAAASAVLATHPRSAAAGALLVEADIARGGSAAGLRAYERWLADRKLEDGYLLRRVARELLWEAAGVLEFKIDALRHLAADDDVQARAALAAMMAGGDLAGMRALARIGDEGAVRRLINAMQAQKSGSKGYFIEALIESRSPLAVPPLTTILSDANRPADVAAAADGLGILGGASAIPELKRLLSDPAFPYPGLIAGALYRLNDGAGMATLQRMLASEHAAVRKGAAEMMAANPDATWHQVVRALMSDPDPINRLAGAKLIARYELDAARETLEALLRDENPAVRQLAGIAIAERTAVDFATLRRLFRGEGPVRVRAAGRVLELTR